ncbi:response regulator [candidate division KSB1 bacterium]|nr:response regulator [candidate division KSB1 bacterium]
MSQSTVTYIIQDRKGFMWFATYDGINKYDGYNIKVYKYSADDSASLGNNNTTYLFEDSGGYIWILNNANDGISRFNPVTEKFTRFQHDPEDSTSISSNEVFHAMQDKSGRIWLSTRNAINLAVENDEANTIKFKKYRFLSPERPVIWIHEGQNGKLLLFADSLYFFDPTHEKIANGNIKLNITRIISACEDSARNIWLGTAMNGLLKLDYNKKTQRYSKYEALNINVVPNKRNHVLIDDNQTIWIATESQGLFQYNEQKNQLINFTNDKFNPHSISDNTVYSLYIDNSKILWIGTFSQGLCKYDLIKKQFEHYKAIPNNRNSLSGNVISSIQSVNLDELWVGMDLDGGITRMVFANDKQPEYIHYLHDPSNNNTIGGNSILCLTQRKNGHVWAGCAGGHISKIIPEVPGSAESPIIKRYKFDLWTFTIYEDSQGILWGGTWENGLWKYSDKNDDFIFYRNDPDNSSSICDNVIWALGEDMQGNVWIGGHGKGISILPRSEKDKINPQFINFRQEKGNPKSLSSNTINVFYQDHTGVMWIGTAGGLNKVVKKEMNLNHLEFISYHVRNGLPSEGITGIVEDNHGNLWLSSANGISKFNVSDLSFTNYDERDGLQGNEFWHNAYFKDQSGKIYFGGPNGLNAFYPDSIRANPYPPKIAFTDIKFYNKSLNVGEALNGDVILPKSISESSDLTISYKNNAFTIEFVALHFAQPEKNKYAYIMKGFDKQWIETDADRHFATYTNLPAGKYSFKVKASNCDGLWNETGVSINLEITPPFWLTWWFKSGILLAFLFTTFTIYQYRMVAIKQRNIFLEQKINERTLDLKLAHENLETAYTTLEDKKNLLQTLIDIIPDHIYVKDKMCRFILNNKSHLHLLGAKKQDDVLGKTDLDIFPDELSNKYYVDEQQVLKTGVPKINEEEQVIDKTTGRQYWVAATKVRFTNSQGEVQGIVGISHDISERKEYEIELRAAMIESEKSLEIAEAANRSKSEFLANMSHEIRTPMNGVIGMTELALDLAINKQQRDYLKIAKQSAESLLDLLNDILDFSKIEAGKLDLEEIDFALRDVIEIAISTFALRAQSKGLELLCDIEHNVPHYLKGDPGRLRQIIINLIGNAIKFTEKGEIVVRIKRTNTQHCENRGMIGLHFSVADTGIGIAEDKLDKIFQCFSQEDSSTTRRYGGTGLGLTISKRLSELMGGKIWVTSDKGNGSNFQFTAYFKAGKPVNEIELSQSDNIDFNNKRVLIVDDNETNCLILQKITELWHFRPHICFNGKDALAAIYKATVEEEPFALILLDYMMPEMDGFAFAQKVRANKKWDDIKIIMMSSISKDGNDTNSKEIGINGYLNKPIRQSDLLHMVNIVFGKISDKTRCEEETSDSEETMSHLNILLAEDNIVNQKVATSLLSKWGHNVTVANDGKEAIEQLEQNNFDIVLMDVQMPNMDGIEATKAIRNSKSLTNNTKIPIIAMTALAMKGDRERFLDAGMDDYISKPVNMEELRHTLQKYVVMLENIENNNS